MASNSNQSATPGGDEAIRERVQELTWALVDENINGEEFGLLDTLLLSDDAARDTYVDCMQLHTDLMFHFGNPAAKGAASGMSPVLGFLGDAMPSTGVQPPVSGPN